MDAHRNRKDMIDIARKNGRSVRAALIPFVFTIPIIACVGAKTGGQEWTMRSKPIGLEDFFYKLHDIIENGVLLQEEFPSNVNIHLVFGDVSINRIEDSELIKYLELSPSSNDTSEGKEWSCNDSSAVYSWRKEISKEHKRRRSIVVTTEFLYNEPLCYISVDMVMNIFGSPARITPIFGQQPPPHGRNIVIRPPTHRLGNSDITFEISGNKYSSTLELEILGDGVVRGFTLSQKDK